MPRRLRSLFPPAGRRIGQAYGSTPVRVKRQGQLKTERDWPHPPHQFAENFTSLIASKFCTPPPTRLVV